jgi:hypothetical protein
MRRQSVCWLIVPTAVLVLSGLTAARIVRAEIYVYPSKGQSQEQQQRDEWECHQWATQQTGVDPQQIAEQATSAEAAEAYGGPRPNVIGGGMRGAAVGAVGGAIGGDAGKGAAIGAAVGGLGSVMRARRETEWRYQAYSNMANTQRADLRRYDRAYATCLEGRGYAVSR